MIVLVCRFPEQTGDPEDLLAHAAADITGKPRPVAPGPGQAQPGTLVPAAEYLSGQVRDKLRLRALQLLILGIDDLNGQAVLFQRPSA